jgi:hypothetical protein
MAYTFSEALPAVPDTPMREEDLAAVREFVKLQ